MHNSDNQTEVNLSRRFLYVDDDQSLFPSIKRYANHFGVTFQTATSAHNALALLQSEPEKYFLVLTDHYMPGMNGDVLLETIKNKWPFIRRAMISGDDTTESISKGYQTGNIFRFLRKPVEESAIRQLLEDARKDVLSESSDDGVIIHDRQYLIYSCFDKAFQDSPLKSAFPHLEAEMLRYCQRVWQAAGLSRLALIDKESIDFLKKLESALITSMLNVRGLLESSAGASDGFALSAMMKQFNITGIKSFDRYLEYSEPVFAAMIQKLIIYYELISLDPNQMIKVSADSISMGLGDPFFYNDIFNPTLESVPKGIEIASLSVETFMLFFFLKLKVHIEYSELLQIKLLL